MVSVKEMLGHEKLSTTAIYTYVSMTAIYTHVSMDRLRKAYDQATPV
jgi:site-specific recombinase XerD